MRSSNRSTATSSSLQDGVTAYQVGRRRTDPRFLAVVAVAWLAAGVAMLLMLHAGWRLVPAVFSFGVGLLYLRGAAGSFLRRS